MTTPADVTHFPKRCAHGVALVFWRRMSAPGEWTARDCAPCLREEEARDAAAQAVTEAWLDRLSERMRRGK